MKMNTLLAIVEHTSSGLAKAMESCADAFRSKHSLFQGSKKTFAPRDGYADDPSKQGTVNVAATVDEKLSSLSREWKKHLGNLFQIEATNSVGAGKVELKVGDVSFGKLSAIELMRLRNILSDKNLTDMLRNIPVRTDSVVWTQSTDPEYDGRAVFQTEMIKGVTKTTEKEEYILRDPNINPENLPVNYNAKTSVKSKTVETGDYTSQNFSGEWSQKQKDDALARKADLYEAVIKALKEVNDCETIASNLDTDRFVDFLFQG